MAERRNWTRRWFDVCRRRGEDLRTSDAVIRELSAGQYPGQEDALRLASSVVPLARTAKVVEVSDAMINQNLMPAGADGDAIHLAFACVHDCDALITWNCKHIANPNKSRHLAVICGRLALTPPNIMTPEQYLIHVP